MYLNPIPSVDRARAFASKLADKGYWISDTLEAELADQFEQVRAEGRGLRQIDYKRSDHARGICNTETCTECQSFESNDSDK